MDDARQPRPVCGDDYAKTFMDAHGMHIYDMFKEEVHCNASMLVRHRIIDDMLRRQLISNPDLCVITIGAGLDSRPYRLAGGKWFELDEPAVVAHKNKRLSPTRCPNQLERISIDFSKDVLEDKLAFLATEDPVVIIMEGVFIYLDEDDIRKTLSTFHQLFPTHKLICDLVNRDMVERYGRSLHEKIEGIGTHFKPVSFPDRVFTANGYRISNRISVLERSADFGFNTIPKWLFKFFFSADMYGNAVYEFESHELYSDLTI
jgi:methyltransferase (TIGR00027 family)